MKLLFCAGALALGLSGCVSGPGHVVTADGPPPSDKGAKSGTVASFAAAYEASRETTMPSKVTDKTGQPPQPVSESEIRQKAAHMVRIGVELEYQLCADFFRDAGRRQQLMLFGKDFLALAGSIATAAIGVASAASGAPNATAIAWTGFGAASGTALISTVQRNFLFSEDNVQQVQNLTLKAVSVARAQALAPERINDYTFASGVSALIDVQAQCEVQNILVLVREAIGAANPVPSVDVSGSTADIVKSKIGWIVLNGIPISNEQLQMLFWLLVESPRPTEEQKSKLIYPSLSVLNPAPVDRAGVTNQAFEARVDQIRQAMSTLLPATIAQIRANIAERAAKSIDDANIKIRPITTFSGGTSGRIGVVVR